MELVEINFGIVDKRFLAKSVGLLNPPDPLIVRDDVPIEAAIKVLKAHRVGCVIVVNEVGKVVGIFSERDVILKVGLSGIDIKTVPVSQVMTPNPHTEQMTTTIAFALNMMSQGGYRHIPLVDDDDNPVGIISVKNIVDYIVTALNDDLMRFP